MYVYAPIYIYIQDWDVGDEEEEEEGAARFG